VALKLRRRVRKYTATKLTITIVDATLFALEPGMIHCPMMADSQVVVERPKPEVGFRRLDLQSVYAAAPIAPKFKKAHHPGRAAFHHSNT
jgi:hypothetical protein